jgi:putative endonuclease
LKKSESESESEYSHFFYDRITVQKLAEMKEYYVYAIVSEKDSVIYVGIATDCEVRLKEHNSGKSKYTSGHIPWRLFYSEEAGDAVSARSREKYFKTGAGKRRLKAILESGQ